MYRKRQKGTQIMELLPAVPLPDFPSCQNAFQDDCTRVRVDIGAVRNKTKVRILDIPALLVKERPDEPGKVQQKSVN